MFPDRSMPCVDLTSHPDGQGSILRISEVNSLRGTIFNLLNTMIGGGVLGLPFAVQQTGIAAGGLLLLLIAGITDISAWMLLVSVDATRELSFAMVAEKLYGRWLGVCVDCAVLFNNFGTLVSYVVILGDLIPPFMTYLDAPATLQDHRIVLSAIALCALLPLSLLRSMGALRHVSLLCLLMILMFSLILIAMGTGCIALPQPTDARLEYIPSSRQAFFSQMSVMVFAYNCLMNVPVLYGELRRKSRDTVDSTFATKRSKMMTAMHFSLTTCAVTYVGVGVFGYVAFRSGTQHDILTNLDYHIFSPAPYVKVSYSLVIICSYPVMCFSCVASLHRLLLHLREAAGRGKYNYQPFQAFSPSSSPAFRSPGWSKTAIWSPPPEEAEVTMTEEDVTTPEDKEGLHALLLPPHPPQKPDFSAPGPSLALPSAPPSETGRIVEATGIVISTLLIGLAVPDLSVVFALTGGICGGSITFIFPGLFFLRVPSATSKSCRLCLGYGVLWIGILVSIATTAISFEDLFAG
mmetsp:Transcript_38379/g.110935  ORF Transcript_38379/g.110935 Transcript_38379/m.110935 type:complete len:521 (+) Transcript_38379:97-1659(+)